MKYAALIALSSLITASTLHGQFTQIDISAQANADIQSYSFGGNYPLGGTMLNVAGVPFGLAELGGVSTTTGVVQSPQPGTFDYTFSVPAGTQATALYSLANTAFGSLGINEGSILVTGTGGETASLTLLEGFNIRDHNESFFVNTLSDPTVVPTYFLNGAPTTSGSVQTRLDMQTLILPATFAGDTIATIDFEGTGNGAPDGSAFLAGLTLSDAPRAVPDSSLPLPLVAGLFLAMVAAMRINQNQVRA